MSLTSSIAPLLEPLQLGPFELKNRVVMASLTRSRAVPTNVPISLSAEYYAQRARGGAGLVISEGALITQQGTQWQNPPGIWNKEQVDAWKNIVNAVHAEGSIMYCQIWHLGRILHPDAPEQIASGQPVWGPSAIKARNFEGKFRFLPGKPGCVIPREIEDTKPFIDMYRNAAINAKEAGFDGIEIIASNGYLIAQFLDSGVNRRTDAYGGSAQNRARFGLEVIKAVVEVFGPNKVGLKVNPAGGGNDVGMPLEDTIETYSYFLNEADKLDLAFICLMKCIPFHDHIVDGKSRQTPHDVLKTYRPVIKNSAVFWNGDVTPGEGASLIASGQIDAVEFGRLWIAHPDLGKRIEHGKPLDAQINYKSIYGFPTENEEELRRGYTDYSEAEY